LAREDPDYLKQAIKRPKPGREFLIALVLRSRGSQRTGPGCIGPLRVALAKRDDTKVLDVYAAALEIDCVAAAPQHASIASELRDKWSRIHAQDPRTLEEGKRAVVRRLGEAVRTIDDRRRSGEDCPVEPAYPQLYAIACTERSYPVQLAATQEIGSASGAYAALRGRLEAPCQTCRDERAARWPGAKADGPDPGRDASRAATVSAWLAPMLVGVTGGGPSAEDKDLAKHAQEDLAQWLRHVSPDDRVPGETELPVYLEIALAQGFKYAANRRPAHPDTLSEARIYLAEQALEMLKGARYWFSQLTLFHALCLLNLSDGLRPANGRLADGRAGPGRNRARPEAIVQHWLDVAGRDHRLRAPGTPQALHPFVRETAQLVVQALKTGRPQRYCWIDESGVVGQVGSRNLSQGSPHGKHHLWIPPSAGWTALDGRAQQLVADVLLLLNLADRGDQPAERERRLKRSNRNDLPPCITHYRDALEPGRTVGTATSAVPGVSCVDGCVFELCPYPPKGAQPRVEMSEAFCRRQQTIITRPRDPRTGRAPWQQMRPRQLKQFWEEMADRARGPRPRSAGPDRSGASQKKRTATTT